MARSNSNHAHSRWKRVYLIAKALLESPVEGREEIALFECRGDAALLASVWDLVRRSSTEMTFLESGLVPQSPGTPAIQSGRRIGAYRLVRELGRGGMGQVFLAERDDQQFTKQVALKVTHGFATEELRTRFVRERQILADLDHPGMARLLDGGETEDGIPFLAMEYVEGKPIHEYCAENRLGRNERVRLIIAVCSIIEFAHRNQVVHRDVKPSNIMVTADGLPKLLDFGIAKLLTPLAGENDKTLAGLGLMTPAYASPEQVAGEAITPASDLYSLGVLLYELLAGRLPYEVQGVPLLDALRVVCERDAALAGGVDPELKGDMEAILARALEKHPKRRYATVEEFRRDLERYLAGYPVHARPATWSYRAYKFGRRHWRSVSAAAAAFAIAGVAGLSTLVHIQKVDRSAEEIHQQAGRLLSGYAETLGDLPGTLVLRSQVASDTSRLLERAALDVASAPGLAREVADAYRKLAEVQGAGWENLGDLVGAARSLRKAIGIRESLSKQAPGDARVLADLAADLTKLSTVYARAGEREFEATVRRALAIFDELPAEVADQRAVLEFRAEALNDLSYVYSMRGDHTRTIAVARKYVQLRERLQAMDPGSLAAINLQHARQRLADYLLELPKLDEAAAVARSAAEELRADRPGEAAATPSELRKSRYVLGCALVVLGKASFRSGDLAEANQALAQSVHNFEGLVAADPGEYRSTSELIDALLHHSMVLRALGRAWPARAAARRMIAVAVTHLVATPSTQDANGDMVSYWIQAVGEVPGPLTLEDERVLEQALAKVGDRPGAQWARWRLATAESLANAAQRRHDFVSAVRWRRAVVGVPEQSEVRWVESYLRLGEAARAAGQSKEACEAFRWAVEHLGQMQEDGGVPVGTLRARVAAGVRGCR